MAGSSPMILLPASPGRLERQPIYCYNIMAMSKRPRTPRGDVGSAEFKARCLELVDHVREARAEYIVTRHGEPVARLVPVEGTRVAGFIGSMKGTVLGYDDPFDPIPGTWDVNAVTGSAD